MPILREIEVRYTFKEIDCDVTGKALDNPKRTHEVFSFLRFEPKEKFIVVNLSNQNTIMSYETVASGTVNSVSLRPAEVLRTAIIINAPAIVLVHNHPSGIVNPSKADIAFTKVVIDAAKLLSIDVLDHIIIGESDFYSLKQHGDM
ncbi:DNA repair protein RadC [Colwellia demingiae]|uniref:DNA repair protein RadC n=1 Tax=Colwellia demingiae TaxID=89401 RepID=A0A5C6Q905_9GAMM|nr:JAB domain-containing protein [Colwellia demingiae]TWX65535.1 DNA repair protein RadC [Colwellia demingiae]